MHCINIASAPKDFIRTISTLIIASLLVVLVGCGATSTTSQVGSVSSPGSPATAAAPVQTSTASGDGGPATSAELLQPAGVAVDGSGNIFIADTGNCRIQKVTASTGDISTVAGTGVCGSSGDGGPATSAELWGPWGIAVDGSGNIFIADTYNNRIREVTASTGDISTVAGNGGCDYNGDGIPATTADICLPITVAVNGSGNIFIADMGNNRIRNVTAGIISTIAGNGTQGNSGDGGPATAAELYWPYGVALDASGNVYIGDTDNRSIRKVTVSTGIISTLASTPNYLAGIAVDTSGNVYAAVYGTNSVSKLTASTSVLSTLAGTGVAGYNGDGIPATTAELNGPMGVAVDTSGNVYIADRSNNRIREVTASTGNISTVAGTGTN